MISEPRKSATNFIWITKAEVTQAFFLIFATKKMLKSRKFYYLLFVLGALYVLLVQQFFQKEGRFIIQTPAYPSETIYTYTNNFQELNIPINQDISLHGLWFKQENPQALVLLFPDSDADFQNIEIEKNLYYSNGFDVLITAYRSSAKAEGKLQLEDDLYADAQQWYNFAKSQFEDKNIILAGQGFGGSIAAQLARNNQMNTLILENPYFSFGDYQSRAKYWWLPHTYFTSFHLNTWDNVRKTKSDIILLQDVNKKGDKNSLSNYLKSSDQSYWLEKNNEIPPSSLNRNALLFDGFLYPLLPTNKTE